MPLSTTFLESITQALLGRATEPGKLDDAAQQVANMVRGIGQSAKNLEKLSKDVSTIFKAAAHTTSRAQGREGGLTSQEATNIFAKLVKPIHDQLSNMVKLTSVANRDFTKDATLEKQHRLALRQQLTKVQQKLEQRQGRIAANPPRADEPQWQRGLQAAVEKLSLATDRAIKQAFTLHQEQMIAIRRNAREMLYGPGGIVPILKESGRADYSQPYVNKYNQVAASPSTRRLEGPNELFTKLEIAGIVGGITARGKRAPASYATPDFLGAGAFGLTKDMHTLREFLGNTKIALRDAAAAKALFAQYTQQISFFEGANARRGKRVIRREDLRSGEDIQLLAMTGLNTRIFNASLPDSYHESQRRRAESRQLQNPLYVQKMAEVDAARRQPWAAPTHQFTAKEFNTFAGRYGRAPHFSAIQTSAQMLNYYEPTSPQYWRAAQVLGGSLRSGEREAEARKWLAAGGGAGAGAGADRPRKSAGEWMRSGRANFWEDESGEFRPGAFGEFWRKMRGTRTAPGTQSQARMKDYAAQASRIMSGEEQLHPSENVRASMRYDALIDKMGRLNKVVGETEAAFKRYKEVIAPEKKAAAERKRQEGLAAAANILAGTQVGIGSREQQLAARRGHIGTLAGRRTADITGAFDAATGAAGFRAMEADFRLKSAEARRKAMLPNLTKKYGAKLGTEMANNITRLPGARAAITEFQYASMEPGANAEALIDTAAKNYALAMHGPGPEESLKKLRGITAAKVAGFLGGPTAQERYQTKLGRVGEDRAYQESELDRQQATLSGKRTAAVEKEAQKRATIEQKYGATAGKVADEIGRRYSAMMGKVADTASKKHATIVKFLKGEDVRGGGGEGGGGGGGRRSFGSWMSGGQAGRSGLGFGLGYPALVAFDAAIKDVIKDSTIYAARVQMMEFSTVQMAKVAGLNVGQVEAEVEAIKKMNVTTQEANAVAQKMMLTQQDLAKSTNLVRVAQDLAALSGQDAMQTIDRLMTAIVTGYTRNLHMMGLQVTMVSAMRHLQIERKAAGLKGQPTEMERREQLVKEIGLQGAKFAGTYERSLMTAGGQFAYLRKEAMETSNVLGKYFLPEFGQVMNKMVGGLHLVQEHGDAFAHLSSVLASLGVTLNILGTAKFMTWMMGTAGPLPPIVKIGAIAAGIGAYALLNQEPGAALIGNKDVATGKMREQMAMLESSIARGEAALPKLTGQLLIDTSFDVGVQKEQLAAYKKRIPEAEVDLRDQLAELYNRNKKSQDTAIANFRKEMYKPPGLAAGFSNDWSLIGIGINKLTNQGIYSRWVTPDILQRAKELRQKSAELSPPLPESMENLRARQDALMENYLMDAEARMSSASEKLLAFGPEAIEKRFMRGVQTPGLRIEMERKKEAFPFEHAAEFEESFRQRAAAEPDAAKKKAFLDLAERAHTNLVLVAKDSLKDIDVGAGAAYSRNLEQIDMQTEAARIQGQVVRGNYASERKASEELYTYQKKHLHDDEVTRRQVESERVKRNIEVEARQREGILGRQETVSQYTFGRLAQGVLHAPGQTTEEALKNAFEVEKAGLMELTNDEEKRNKILEAQLNLKERISELPSEEFKYLVGRGIARRAQDVGTQLLTAGILAKGTPGYGGPASDLAAIERERQANVGRIAADLSDQLKLAAEHSETIPKGVTAPEYERDLRRKAEEDTREAQVAARNQILETLDKWRDSEGERKASSIGRVGQMREQEIAASNSGPGSEYSNVEKVHSLRMQYIQQEYEARGETLDALRTKEEETLDAEHSKLMEMLDLQRKQVESIRSFASELFDVVTTKHAQGLRDFMIGQVRGLGSKVFGNLAAELLKDFPFTLPGTTTKVYDPSAPGGVGHRPNFLGRILAGMPFGSHVTSEEVAAQRAVRDTAAAAVVADNYLRDILAELKKLTGDQSPQSPQSHLSPAPNIRWSYGIPASLPPIFGSDGPLGLGRIPIGTPFFGGGFGIPGTSDIGGLNIPGISVPGTSDGGGGILSDILSGMQGPTGARIASAGLAGMLATTNLASTAMSIKTPTANMSQEAADLSDFAKYGLPPSGGGSGSGGAAATKRQKDIAAAMMVATGIYQAATSFGRGGGARGALFGTGGALQAGAGIAALIPGGQAIAAGLEVASMIADFTGSMFMDPRQARANQIANYLGYMQYLGPAQIAMTSSLRGSMVSEGKGGGATDTGIAATDLQVNQPYMLKENPNPPFWSSPLAYLLGSNKPSVYQIPPANYGLSASDFSTSQQYGYVGVPGTVSYENLPADVATQQVNYNINVNAMDSKSIIDRSPDIAAAVQKELELGTGLGQSLSNSIFGAG